MSRLHPLWSRLPDERLLDVRLCDLGLAIEGTALNQRVQQLYRELERRHLQFRPHCWLSSEWFSPAGVPGIAIPFYLAHPRLKKLEEKMMLEVEGGTKASCMRILRHEAGHAIEVAFRLNRRAEWRRIFGSSSRPYPEYYTPKPISRDFVLHLDWWYGQSHPIEDFAETFAVWLRPGSQWRARYRDWPALRKLEYVDALMGDIAGTRPLVRSRARIDPVHRLRVTLRQHYQERKAKYGSDFPDFYVRDLRRLFSDAPAHKHCPAASTFLRRTGPQLRRLVASWTGESAYIIDLVLREMIGHSKRLNLRVHRSDSDVKLELAVLLTRQTMQYLLSTDHQIAL